ncbi:hypothetical protein GGR51DRAFT_528124 [Nemania sp. FL0031]|nr:hypothetical protein GGR51DRAFT_528124 [Nemania sp. FL0031]
MMAYSHTLDDVRLTPLQAHYSRDSHDSHDSTSRASNSMMQQPQQPRRKRSPTCPDATCTRAHYAHPITNSTTLESASKPLLTSHSSLSSSPSRLQSRFHRSLASPIDCSDVAAADPERTAELWKSVMSYIADTESSRGKRRGTPSVAESQQQTPTTSASSSSRAKKGLTAKVNDPDFELSVLEPYGITIRAKSSTKNFYKHFGFSGLPEDRIERFNTYKNMLQLSVLLKPDTERKERIQREYRAMNEYRCNEAEYSAYALHNIFLDEPRYPALLTTGDERWLPVRMLQLVQKPSENEWEKPPLLELPEKQYEWDVRPDCAYYASLQAFPPIIRPSVEKYVSVVQERAFSPYLTIEFKKNNETAITAQNQVAVASAIALYNRWRLKREALQITNDGNWSEEQKLQIRHYGITFTGSKWELWFSIPKTYDNWTGCTMFSMRRGQCSMLDSVGLLLSSINDLHYWGLMVHAKSCKVDIDTIIKGNAGRQDSITCTGDGQVKNASEDTIRSKEKSRIHYIS